MRGTYEPRAPCDGFSRQLGGHFQSHGHTGPQDQDEKETLRSAEGEGVPCERPRIERVDVGRQSLGESLRANWLAS